MAFRQPTHAPQRLYTSTSQGPLQTQIPEHIPQPAEEPQEWVLFSPVSGSDRTQTGTSITTQGDRQARTPGRSRIADYSSLDYDDEDAEDGELDSLDSHLHAFRADHSFYRNSGQENDALNDSVPVLPTHDGLGSFRVDLGEGVQEQLYAFEQFNPRRVKRRRESLELGDATLGGDLEDLETQKEREKTRRIEEWRMEQSRFLVEEIQRETRRRRKQSLSNASQHGRGRRMSVLDDDENVETATLGGVDSADTTGSEQQKESSEEHEGEGFWKRLTQTVIRDLMGIDDRLLAILFGEALPELEEDDDLSTTPPATGLEHMSHLRDSTWEHRLLDRISREFGILVNQLTDHPGAFSTYMRTRARERQTPLPYAGLPVIPESATTKDIDQLPNLTPATTQASIHQSNTDLDNTATFQPTLQSTTRPLEISATTSTLPPSNTPPTPTPLTYLDEIAEREYWERELDLKMVFRYLRSRFTNTTPPPPTLSTRQDQDSKPNNNQESSASIVAARAARVRQYHPLVRTKPLPTSSTTTGPVRSNRVVGANSNASPPVRLRRESDYSSCKSQSAKWSGGSRNYWDGNGGKGGKGSSLSGSMGVSTGGMGAWGEV